ncbi:hypothetical protein EJD97_015120 [Solanum chilense]|uniref:Uncharacterized protein n=1 Tax=Solanum chilense TaxID=4083 RepID=A0A6N2BAD1_SOLCI|nr:hypothetical protein EJD97_015120 [Solanum chilense]
MTKSGSSKRNSSKNKHASSSKNPKTPKKRGRKAAPPIVRPTLPTNMNYVIKHIPTNALKFGPTYNTNFVEHLVSSIQDEEIEHGDLDEEIHIRHAKGNVLKFIISDFPIVTGLNCKDHNYVPPNPPNSSIPDSDDVHSDEVPSFKDFTAKPPDILLRRSSRGANVDKKFGDLDSKVETLDALIKSSHSELLKAIGARDNKSEKDMGGVSSPYMMDDSAAKGNVGTHFNFGTFDQQTVSQKHMNFATVDDVTETANDIRKQC